MAERRFFEPKGPFTVGVVASVGEATLKDSAAADRQIDDIAPLTSAKPTHVSFLDNRRYVDDFRASNAGAAFVSQDHADKAPPNMVVLVTSTPYLAYAKASQLFYPTSPVEVQGIHASAAIAPTARIGDACQIDAGAVVSDGAQVGARCRIAANAVVGRHVVIGDDCSIGMGATLSYCLIGARVIIHGGVRIGQDGFGYAPGPTGLQKVAQVGRVIIEDDVEIGANTTIDRGAGPDTLVGAGTKIDNLVQIAHNVRIGRNCVIVAQVGISGSTHLEDNVVLAGQVGVAGHLRIGAGATVAAQGGVSSSIPQGETFGGTPAVPMQQWRRQVARLALMAKGKIRGAG